MELTAEELALLTRMLTSHAYREALAAIRFREARHFAPSSSLATYVMNVSAQERDHFQGCITVADSLGINMRSLVRQRMRRLPLGIPTFGSWLDVACAHALNDRAGYHVLAAIIGSKITQYSALAEGIIREEEEHGASGVKLLTQCRQASDDAVFAETMRVHLRAAIACIGRAGSAGDQRALALCLKTRSADDVLRAFWLEAVAICNEVGLARLVERGPDPLMSGF